MYIHESLAYKRKELGLSQIELAERAGVSRISVIRVEQGKDTAMSIVMRIASAMGLALDLVDEQVVLDRQLLALQEQKRGLDSQIELVTTLIDNAKS